MHFCTILKEHAHIHCDLRWGFSQVEGPIIGYYGHPIGASNEGGRKGGGVTRSAQAARPIVVARNQA